MPSPTACPLALALAGLFLGSCFVAPGGEPDHDLCPAGRCDGFADGGAPLMSAELCEDQVTACEVAAYVRDCDAGLEGGVDGSVDDDDGPLRMLTWNIRDFPMAASTVEAVAGVLLGLDVDVVAVQEIGEPAAFEDLVAALPGYEGLLNDDPGGYTRVGLIYRVPRVTLLEEQTIFPDDWYAFPRPPLVATLSASAGPGRVFDFVAVVVHLKAQLDAESRERRRAACERLEDWLEALAAEGEEEDFVLLGDWNDELTDWGSHNVFRAFLDQPDAYTFLTLALAEAGEFTYVPFESFLDHVLVSASALDELGGGETAVLGLEGSVPDYLAVLSDHRPVLSVFELP